MRGLRGRTMVRSETEKEDMGLTRQRFNRNGTIHDERCGLSRSRDETSERYSGRRDEDWR